MGFVVDAALLERLQHWGGNISALHRELVAKADGAKVPSLATLHRAVTQALAANAPTGGELPDPEQAKTMDDLAGYCRALAGADAITEVLVWAVTRPRPKVRSPTHSR